MATMFLYDADGQRVGKQTVRWDEVDQRWRTNLTRFLIDPQHPSGYAHRLAERGEGGEEDRAYLHGLHPIAEVAPDRARYALVDGHGSVRGQVEEGGRLAGVRDYDAFGSELRGEFATTRETDSEGFGYAGEFYDPSSGLQDLRARQYEPLLGRFRTMDSYEGRQELPAGQHKYVYCQNEPVNHADPSGHDFMPTQAVTSGGIGTLARMALPAVGRTLVHSRNLLGRSMVQASRLRVGDPTEYLTGRAVGAIATLATVATGLAIGVAFDETDENESDGILYRGMRGELMPEIGPFSAALGIRDPKDIPMQRDGQVLAGDQGLSVVPDNPSLLLKTHLREHIEKGKVKIWGVYRRLLDPRLTYRPDPSRPLEHGYIGPTTDMPVGTFKQLIEETQRQWSQLTD